MSTSEQKKSKNISTDATGRSKMKKEEKTQEKSGKKTHRVLTGRSNLRKRSPKWKEKPSFGYRNARLCLLSGLRSIKFCKEIDLGQITKKRLSRERSQDDPQRKIPHERNRAGAPRGKCHMLKKAFLKNLGMLHSGGEKTQEKMSKL